MTVLSVFALVIIAGFYGVAFSAGGGFEHLPGCEPENLPLPTSGPYLYGYFTVARDKHRCSNPELGLCDINCRHYNVQVVLFRELSSIRLFSFEDPPDTIEDDLDLCSRATGLKKIYKSYPCDLQVQKSFGIDGVPVITKISIIKKDFCGTKNEMIYGIVQIRVVPRK